MDDEDITQTSDEVQDDAAPAEQSSEGNDAFATVRQHYEAGLDLTDDEVDQIADAAVGFLRGILACFGEDHAAIDEYVGDEGELILDVNGGDLAVLIGRHGRTLDSLQMVLNSLMSSNLRFHYPVVVDIEGYKSRRKEKLQNMARSAAARAKRQHGKVALAPMNAYERRLVHLALVDDDGVTTHSEGEDPNRRVIVTAVRSK